MSGKLWAKKVRKSRFDLVSNAIVLSIILTSCAPTIPTEDPTQLSNMQLLVYYGYLIRSKAPVLTTKTAVENEVVRRNLLSVEQVREAEMRVVHLGMSDSQVFVTIGAPDEVLVPPDYRDLDAWLYGSFRFFHVTEAEPNELHMEQVVASQTEYSGSVLFVRHNVVVGMRMLAFDDNWKFGFATGGQTFYVPVNTPSNWKDVVCHDPLVPYQVSLWCTYGTH